MKSKAILLFLSVIVFQFGQAQLSNSAKRVLFVLDASGSMDAQWGETSKMDIAKETLLELVDSVQRQDPTLSIGLRVFGHQYPRKENNCRDSELSIDFGTNNFVKFSAVLEQITPKGQTPIAYSLIESAKDFKDSETINAIILITDGLENCEGDPCEAARFLNEKRISINPFIIGLDIADSLVSAFDCIGSFVNAKDKVSLEVVLEHTVDMALSETSLSIHLETMDGQSISNTPFSIQDAKTKQTTHSFLHALNAKNKPDTLYIDPRGWHQVIVHTFPPVSSESFQLKPGEHNDVLIQLPKAYWDVEHEVQYDEHAPRFIVRNGDDWIYNQTLDELPILAGDYELTTSLIPVKNEKLRLEAGEIKRQTYLANGKLSIKNNTEIRASIFNTESEIWQLVKDLGVFDTDMSLKLQPGQYTMVFIEENDTNSELTAQYPFTMYPEKTTVIPLR